MAGGVRLEFAQFGSFDEFSVYRSGTTMGIGELPEPIATGLSKMYYVDGTAEVDREYYYRVSVRRGETTLISDEVYILIENPDGPVLTIPTDYTLRYDLNGDLYDRSANLNHGIKTAGSGFAPGRKPDTQSFKFVSGTNTLIKSGTAVSIDSTKLTVSFWYYKDPAGSQVGNIINNKDGNNSYFQIADGNWNSGIGVNSQGLGGSGENIFQASGGAGGNEGAWNHILIEFDRELNAANEITLYVNNVKVTGTKPASNNFDNPIDSGIVTIGGLDGTMNSLWASVQDLRIYNRVLTIGEREALFNE